MDRPDRESREVMAIVRQWAGDRIEQMSIDEAYLEVSATCPGSSPDESLERALPLARQIKHAIQERRRLTATIGVAPNKLLAKLASDYQKPDGLTLIRESEKRSFLRPLSVRVLHGVGPATAQALAVAGLHTVGDIQDYLGDLRSLVGSWAPELKRFAFGEDDRPLDLGDEIKSVSRENTLIKLYFGGGALNFGLPPTLPSLQAYLAMLEGTGLPWSVAVLGGDVIESGLARLALERGGHLRVGLEDYAGPRTPSNVELVREAVALATSVGRAVADGRTAAEILGVPARTTSDATP